ncbi:MAG TPA: DUF1501 domain-containing protein [Pirellulales bacterium]|nr:DUF1501 domain-containing protein [Pirellulales bacterium]
MRSQAGSRKADRTALILVWLRGGASHLETYDPKPLASSEYRGPYQPIATRVPGLQICELLPRQAQVAERFTILRSMAHTGGGHPAGSLQLLSGDPAAEDKLKPEFPDCMTVAHSLRTDATRKIPNYVSINGIHSYDNFTIAGPAYLGTAYEPFRVTGDPNDPQFEIPNINLRDPRETERLQGRLALRRSLDKLSRNLDQLGTMQAVDAFELQAASLLTSSDARRAFDLSQEDPKLRDRYGRNTWGQQCLMARRLVEAGVELITTTFDGPLCGRVANWDDHAVNHHVFEAIQFRAPAYDQAVSALIEDVYQRGLDKKVMVIVTGEFGRTPRISYAADSGSGRMQPGRDHWPAANSMLFAGGGIRTGQVIGATDNRGEHVIERRVGPGDFLATIYRHLGIDAPRVAIPNLSGRPVPILNDGEPIAELVGTD